MNSKRDYNFVRFEDEMVIDDLPDTDAVIFTFRFQKFQIKYIASLLWNKYNHLFNGPYDKLVLPCRNYVHFEIGLLLLLY
jgi:hypothetical protein